LKNYEGKTNRVDTQTEKDWKPLFISIKSDLDWLLKAKTEL